MCIKKVIAGVCALAMLGVSGFAEEKIFITDNIQVSAAEQETPDSLSDGSNEEDSPVITDYEYEIMDDGNIRLIKYTGTERSVVVPAEIDGHNVTVLGTKTFFGNRFVRSISLPEGLTEIEDKAFYWCLSLNSIDIPDSVSRIGVYAFHRCGELKSIKIPKNLSVIEEFTFSQCKKLTEVIIPENVTEIANYAFYCCYSLQKITIPDTVLSLGSYIFFECTSLCEVTLPSELESIPYGIFGGCASLEKFDIPDSVTDVGDYAFSGCTSLEKIDFPDSVTYVGKGAFSGCTSLEKIDIPDSVTYVGEEAFSGCTMLIEINASDNLSGMGAYVFNGTAWYDNQPDGVVYFNDFVCGYKGEMPEDTEITIKEGVKKIVPRAFMFQENLVRVNMPDSVGSIGKCSFYGCINLEYFNFPKNLSSIEYGALYRCSKLSEINLPEGITYLGPLAFGECEGITEVVIPGSVDIIPDELFVCCTNLKKIVIQPGVKSIIFHAFGECASLSEVIIPDSVNFIDGRVFEACNNLKKITLPDNGYFSDPDTDYNTFFRTKAELVINHDFGDYISDNNATCTEDGTKTAHCKNCSESVTVVDEGTAGHMIITATAEEASCEEAGHTEGSFCSVCNEVLTEQKEIPAKGHTYENGKCIVCGASDPDIYTMFFENNFIFGNKYDIRDYNCTNVSGLKIKFKEDLPADFNGAVVLGNYVYNAALNSSTCSGNSFEVNFDNLGFWDIPDTVTVYKWYGETPEIESIEFIYTEAPEFTVPENSVVLSSENNQFDISDYNSSEVKSVTIVLKNEVYNGGGQIVFDNWSSSSFNINRASGKYITVDVSNTSGTFSVNFWDSSSEIEKVILNY